MDSIRLAPAIRPKRRGVDMSKAEELDLIKLAQLHPQSPAGREAAGKVLENNRGLILQWCHLLALAGFDLDDMIQESYMAGLEAIRYFRTDRGYQFNSYLKCCVLRRLAKW
jgi:DNA-directed RNA polymerase sigma subunit (sigma70/sigma32)